MALQVVEAVKENKGDPKQAESTLMYGDNIVAVSMNEIL